MVADRNTALWTLDYQRSTPVTDPQTGDGGMDDESRRDDRGESCEDMSA